MLSIIFFGSAIQLTMAAVTNFVAGVAVLTLGVFVLTRNNKNPVNQLFVAICLNITFWVFFSTLADVVRDETTALFFARAAILPPFYFTFFFLVLTHYFPRPTKFTRTRVTLYLLSTFAILPFIGTRFNIESVKLESWGADFVPGILYTILFLYLLLYFGIAGRNLWLVYRSSPDAILRRQVVFLWIGMISYIIAGVVTNLILPSLFHYGRASAYGPAFSLFFVLFVAYAILRHGMFSAKTIAAELFSVALIFIECFLTLSSRSVGDFALQTMALLATIVFCSLLVKSLLRIERDNEQLSTLAGLLKESNKHLRDVDEAKSEFLAIASHQLRTPVSVIKGYLSLIRDGAYGVVGGTLREKISQIFDMNERLIHLINNLLNVTRIEKGRLEFDCREVDLVKAIRGIVAELSIKSGNKGISLKFEEPNQPLPPVFVEEEKLHEVLVNVIDNGIKYASEGEILIYVAPAKVDGFLDLRIEDRGIGMAAEDAGRIFEKFAYTSKPTAQRQAGMSMGIGLYICRKFLQGMGGDIRVERTVPGEGTTMAITLPLVPLKGCLRPGEELRRK